MSTKSFIGHIERTVEALDVLEDITGPETLIEYIAVLTAVKQEIDRRIRIATSRVTEGDEKC